MKKWAIIVLIGVLVLVLIFVGAFLYNNSTKEKIEEKKGSEIVGPQIKVTESNLATYLSSLTIVDDLPENAEISLKTTQNEYVIRKGSVVEGKAKNPDALVEIPSSYIPRMSDGFCKTIQEAINNGDVKMELYISKFSAGWKYKGMYKYRECLSF